MPYINAQTYAKFRISNLNFNILHLSVLAANNTAGFQ